MWFTDCLQLLFHISLVGIKGELTSRGSLPDKLSLVFSLVGTHSNYYKAAHGHFWNQSSTPAVSIVQYGSGDSGCSAAENSRAYNSCTFVYIHQILRHNMPWRNFACLCLTTASREWDTNLHDRLVLRLTSSSSRTVVMYMVSTRLSGTFSHDSQPYKTAEENTASNTFRLTKKGASWLRDKKIINPLRQISYPSGKCDFTNNC